MGLRVPILMRLLRLWASTIRFIGGFPYCWDQHTITTGDSDHHQSLHQDSGHHKALNQHSGQHQHLHQQLRHAWSCACNNAHQTRDNQSHQPHDGGWRRDTSVEGDGECGQCSQCVTLFPRLRPTRTLTLWSHCVIVFYLQLFTTIALSLLFKESKLLKGNTDTLTTMFILVKMVEVLTAIILCCHLVVKCGTLASLASHLDQAAPAHVTRRWSVPQDKAFMLMNLVITVFLIIAVMTQIYFILNFSFSLFHFISSVIPHSILVVIISAHTNGFYLIVRLLETLLDDLVRMLESVCESEQCEERPEPLSDDLSDDGIPTRDEAGEGEADAVSDVQAASWRLLQLCQCQRLLNTYYSTPILTLTSRSISYLIMNLYKSTMVFERIPWIIILFILYDLLQILVFTSTPDLVTDQVSKILYASCHTLILVLS